MSNHFLTEYCFFPVVRSVSVTINPCSAIYFMIFRGEAKSYDNAPKPPFIAEPPVAHMRLGDAEIYPANDLEVKRDRYYRSLHYIVRYEEYYIEIQVRTLFEEAWGEVDHDVLYPYYKDDPVLVNFSKLINRAAGMSDEMSAYFRTELSKERPHRNGVLLDVPVSVPRSSDLATVSSCSSASAPPQSGASLSLKSGNSSGQDILNSLLYKNEV